MSELPINGEIIQQIMQLSPLQQAWLSGYCWAKAQRENPLEAEISEQKLAENRPLAVTIISASQTGNAKWVADQLCQRLKAIDVAVQQFSAKEYKSKNLANEQIVLLISSTQGEGEPPEEAISFYKFLHGRKAPVLKQLEFAVLALGDSSYPQFCQAGKDFDKRLRELEAKPLLERVEADLDFKPTATQWIEQISQILQQKHQTVTPTSLPTVTTAVQTHNVYHKHNPFTATLLTNQKITARESSKDVRHIELDLSGSGLTYQVGDALGVWFENDPQLVAEILSLVGLSGEEIVVIDGDEKSIQEALQYHFEITQLTINQVNHYCQWLENQSLQALVADQTALQKFVQKRPLVALFQQFPSQLSAEQLLALLRPLSPRLYSIASAQDEVGEEVHLTLGVVRFNYQGKNYSGACSGYLADRVGENSGVKVFIEPNHHFRLPEQSDTPIIMIGAGTGIAPFRAFMQQRVAQQAQGKNWLIFGNPHFVSDFLYQLEWQQFAKEGYLHKYSFAWSRDQAEKVYVQHKIRQEAVTLWQWLQQGAVIYVCGDASSMAKAVEQALLAVIIEQGNLTQEMAEEYLDQLRQDNRYQRDIY